MGTQTLLGKAVLTPVAAPGIKPVTLRTGDRNTPTELRTQTKARFCSLVIFPLPEFSNFWSRLWAHKDEQGLTSTNQTLYIDPITATH